MAAHGARPEPEGEKMKIEKNMDLDQLAERMGNAATREDAGIMCEFLLCGPYNDTEEMPNEEWAEMLNFVEETKKLRDEEKSWRVRDSFDRHEEI